MNVHKNARLTPNGRAHLIDLIDRAGLKAAAAATGLSSRTAAKWRDRQACEGVEGLVDRSSRPRQVRAPITEAKRERIVRLRQRRCTMRAIAVRVGVMSPRLAASWPMPGGRSCRRLTHRRRSGVMSTRHQAICCIWIPRSWAALCGRGIG